DSTIYGIGGYNFAVDYAHPQLVTTSLNNVSFEGVPAWVDALASVGTRLYLCYDNTVNDVRHTWLRVVDVVNPLQPVWYPGVDTGGQGFDISAIGNQVHLAQFAIPGLPIWGPLDPPALTLLGSRVFPGGPGPARSRA